jgi:hypothetical protein
MKRQTQRSLENYESPLGDDRLKGKIPLWHNFERVRSDESSSRLGIRWSFAQSEREQNASLRIRQVVQFISSEAVFVFPQKIVWLCFVISSWLLPSICNARFLLIRAQVIIHLPLGFVFVQ